MLEPSIGHHPVEFYGHCYLDSSREAEEAFRSEYSPYLGRRCAKRRKSEPDVTIGTCTVGYKGKGRSGRVAPSLNLHGDLKYTIS